MLFIQPIFSYSDSQDVAPSGFSPLMGPGYQSLLLQLLKAVKAPFSFSAYLSKTDENLRREKQLEGHSLGPGLASQDPGDTLFPGYWLCTDIFIIFLACRRKKPTLHFSSFSIQGNVSRISVTRTKKSNDCFYKKVSILIKFIVLFTLGRLMFYCILYSLVMDGLHTTDYTDPLLKYLISKELISIRT